MNTPRSSPRQFPRLLVVAVILGLAVGLLSMTWLVSGHRREVAEAASQQQAIITLSALTDLVAATRSLSGDVDQAAMAFTEGHTDIVRATVIDYSTRQILSSTDEARRERGFPQRFARRDPEQKAWDALGSKLRAAVTSNRRQGLRVLDEISVRPLDSGHVSLAAPIAYGGNILGLVEVEARSAAVEVGGVPILAGVLMIVGPVLFFGIASWLASRVKTRWALVAAGLVVGLVVVAGLLGVYLVVTLSSLPAARVAAEEQVAARLTEESQRVARLGAVAEVLRPEMWDMDRFRRPRLVDSAEGAKNADDAEDMRRMLGLGGLALVLTALVGMLPGFLK